ncbi:hypothetical protein like AT3G09032 [Hibiscus trionum]|uniref:Josephin-like protein n=1 Tax=Hibiscus trionum TaxID=183268 RepID=A0A9W7MMX7_HIBTR|nr:hypothetical protein like AT3G09032 [Hibiscus trionum]
MWRKTNKPVSFGSDIDNRPTMLLKQGGSGNGRTRSGHRKRVVVIGIFMFRVVKSSRILPAKGLLRRLGSKVASALRFESNRRTSMYKVSSSNLHRSRSVSESIDSHRAEAIEDCIEFLNSSSSSYLSRSNSVSTCSR